MPVAHGNEAGGGRDRRQRHREQQIEWIPRCYGTPDDVKIAAFGVSEPDAGSDVSSLRTRAVYDEENDEWVLNGTKTWITNGGIANIHVIVASVDPTLGSRGQASFIVPEGTPGIRMGQKFKKMGIRASHTAEVILEDCRVPGRVCSVERKARREARARREGKRASSQAAMATFEATRPAVGAQALGIARAAYEYSLEYAKERKQFGRAIIENQAIAFKLANMKMRIDASRLLIWRAAVDGRDPEALYERRGVDVQTLRQRDGGEVPKRRFRFSVDTATYATTRSSAGTVTRRSSRSLKGLRKFSVSSLRAPSLVCKLSRNANSSKLFWSFTRCWRSVTAIHQSIVRT